jgi:hypothetical protein
VGTALKSQQVDLAIRKRDTVLLFEVKTSVSPADLYTAIGQLSLHSLAVQDQFRRAKVRKILVIPEVPDTQLRKRMEEGLGIEVLAFRWKDGVGVEFEEAVLDALHGYARACAPKTATGSSQPGAKAGTRSRRRRL